jgi:hypothetical protein
VIVIWRILAGAVLLAFPLCLMQPMRGPAQQAPPSAPPRHIAMMPMPMPIPTSPAQPAMPTTNIDVEYRETLADSGADAARNKIYAQVQKDCDAAAASFHKTCAVGDIRFTDQARMTTPGAPVLIAHAQLRLSDRSPG